MKESEDNLARGARHAVGRSNRAALKDLFSASCFPILIRLRRSRLGSGGFGIWATMRAMSDENASDTCHGGGGRGRWFGGSIGRRLSPLRRGWRRACSLLKATASKYLQLCFWANASASAAAT